MALSLNKFLFVLLLPCIAFAQQAGSPGDNNADYKDRDQHEKFMRRRKQVGAWQINQLKNGALVVRLKTNRMAIDGLRKQGKDDAASKLEAESFAINKNMMFAYLEHFNFCKVYFINSNMSDSLLQGTRKGIFLDTNLVVNPGIEMKENFYLIAERDYAYNSSIGFVPETQAKTVIEKGNPSKQMAIVLKNKYGHQLKNPMPHEIQEKTGNNGFNFPVQITSQGNGVSVQYYVNRRPVKELEESEIDPKKYGPLTYVTVPRQYTYAKLSDYVSQLNDELRRYYQHSPPPEASKLEDVKPFLY